MAEGEVSRSFLKEYPVVVLPNGIDRSRFCPVDRGLRGRLGLQGKFVILGVANVWERRKGLSYLLRLAEELPEEYQVVLLGLSKKQIRALPGKVLGIGRTSSVEELAEYYSMADVLVNATLEDNFPTTNLEALSCGTPVITFDTGGVRRVWTSPAEEWSKRGISKRCVLRSFRSGRIRSAGKTA